MTPFYTYFHTRNDTCAVFYVGKGKGRRAYSIRRNNTHWKNIVAKHGHTVHMAMTGLTEADAFKHEKFLIACFRDVGVVLTNRTDGGEGCSGAVHTPEMRAKRSAARMGCKHSAETRAKISAANAGRVSYGPTTETREKLRAISTGRVHTNEARKKISAANIGNKNALNHKHTQETKAKMSTAQKGRVHTPEHLAKIGVTKIGNKYALGAIRSPETRAKLSAASKLAWKNRLELPQ